MNPATDNVKNERIAKLAAEYKAGERVFLLETLSQPGQYNVICIPTSYLPKVYSPAPAGTVLNFSGTHHLTEGEIATVLEDNVDGLRQGWTCRNKVQILQVIEAINSLK